MGRWWGVRDYCCPFIIGGEFGRSLIYELTFLYFVVEGEANYKGTCVTGDRVTPVLPLVLSLLSLVPTRRQQNFFTASSFNSCHGPSSPPRNALHYRA